VIPLYRFVYKPQDLDVITIDAYLGQILVFALCIPAIVHIDAGITSLLIKACNSFLYCNKIIFSVSRTLLVLLVPFLLLRFFDILEFWPSGYMFLYFKNAYLRLIAGLIPAIYTSIALYLFSFLFFTLELSDVIVFYKAVFLAVYKHFIFVFFFILRIFSMKSIYIFFKKIGAVYLLDKYGLINSEHYDIKFNLN
jgi:hypothetical protein